MCSWCCDSGNGSDWQDCEWAGHSRTGEASGQLRRAQQSQNAVSEGECSITYVSNTYAHTHRERTVQQRWASARNRLPVQLRCSLGHGGS
jgi:hypothetical protein